MKRAALPILVLSWIPFAHGQITFITFNFSDGVALIANGLDVDDASGQATTTAGGITMTAEAFLDGVSSDTDLNGSSDGFGVNATGTGDETARFDNILGVESMVFFFDTAGTFDQLDLRYIEEEANEGLLIFDGGNTYQLNSVTATGAADIAIIGESFTAGQLITLTLSGSAHAGENFALESFTISAVPEPAAFALWVGLGALGAAACRRPRRQKSGGTPDA